MNYTVLLVAIFLAAGLARPMVSLGEDSMEVPKIETVGNVTYVSGGIGDSEAEMMRGVAKDYPLVMAFVQKLKQQEEFLADIKLQIQDIHKYMVLDVVTEGPYLFAKLPKGKYLITAEHNGDVKQQWVRVDGKKHQRVVFWWPILEQTQEEDTSE